MKRSNYLNIVLTAIAILLGVSVWTTIASRPLLATEAVAVPPGIPDAASQRRDIIEAIRALHAEVELTNRLLESGQFKVEITNLDELKDDSDGGDDSN